MQQIFLEHFLYVVRDLAVIVSALSSIERDNGYLID